MAEEEGVKQPLPRTPAKEKQSTPRRQKGPLVTRSPEDKNKEQRDFSRQSPERTCAIPQDLVW